MGIDYAVAEAWGGGPAGNKWANANLLGAQQNNGVATAAYALLNYFEDETGAYQVDQALAAIGSAKSQLKFMAVDVEDCCGEFVDWKRFQVYQNSQWEVDSITDPSNHIQTVVKSGMSGASAPKWNDAGGKTQDGSVVWKDTGHIVIPDSATRINWISDAVDEIKANNLTPVIYTTRNKWQGFTSNCNSNPNGSKNCSKLIQLPLWDAEPGCGDGIVGLVPFSEFPPNYGWTYRSGNQYHNGNSGCQVKVINGVPVDLDYFDPGLFK